MIRFHSDDGNGDARKLLGQYFSPSRLIRANSLSSLVGADVFLKLELELPTGSFKVRGALYALWSNMQRTSLAEVVASSTGNHGAAVAYAACRLGVKATVFLPRDPNPVKRAKIASLGAIIREQGSDLAEAFDAAAAYSESKAAFFLNDATNLDLPAGPAVIADEIIDEVRNVEAIYVPVGDTALIRGVGARAKALRPEVRIVGVQAERAPAYYLSWRAGTVVTTKTADTFADGLATRVPTDFNVRAIRMIVDDMRLVSDDDILSAINLLLLKENLVVEPAGAATVAALLQEPKVVRTQTLVLLVTGSNIAPNVLRQAATLSSARTSLGPATAP